MVTTASRLPYVCWARTKYFISSVQTSHQVAQKSIMTTRPRRSERYCVPCLVGIAKSGGCLSNEMPASPVPDEAVSVAKISAAKICTNKFSAGDGASPRGSHRMTSDAIEALFEESRRFPPPPEFAEQANAK